MPEQADSPLLRTQSVQGNQLNATHRVSAAETKEFVHKRAGFLIILQLHVIFALTYASQGARDAATAKEATPPESAGVPTQESLVDLPFL